MSADRRSRRPTTRQLARRAALLLVCGLWSCGLAIPASAASADPAANAGAYDGLSARAAEEFADTVLPQQLRERRIPGASVAIVTPGDTVLRGYGTADLDSGRSVNPERTVFAPASVAKLITATAVMQLVEDGRLDLDTDVNTYLDRFRIADGDFADQPITVEHLLTHTAGFAVGDSGTAAATPADVHELGTHLKRNQPRRVRPPGELAVYSNYGMALAGYLVEARTGVPFDRYVERNILRPLGMDSTTFAQPAPASIERRLATGYRVADGEHAPATAALYGHMPPHGAGFRSTAADMARFLRAHLEDGGDILRPETARLMRERQFGNVAGAAGMGYGFQEYERNGQRLLVHQGSVPGYLAVFAMLPDRGIGVYASYNSNGVDGRAAWDLVDAFAEQVTDGRGGQSAGSADAEAPDGGLPDPSRFAGRYGKLRVRDTTDLGRLQALTGGVTVEVGPRGDLVTRGRVTRTGPDEQRWVQVEQGVFRERGGTRTIRFDRVEGNRVLASEDPAGPMVALAWYERPATHLVVAAASLVILACAVVVSPAVHVVRTRGRRIGAAPRVAAATGWGAGILALGSAGTLTAFFANFDENQAAFFRGGSALLDAIALLPVLSAVAAAAGVGAHFLAWRRRWWGRAGRIQHAVMLLAVLGYLGIATLYQVPGIPWW